MDESPEPHAGDTSNVQQPANPSDVYVNFLKSAITDFEEKEQVRSAQEYKVQLANEFIHREQWDDALRVLRPLWQGMTFRKEGWWDITEEICWALRTVAAKTGDCGTLIAVDWELMNSCESPRPIKRLMRSSKQAQPLIRSLVGVMISQELWKVFNM